MSRDLVATRPEVDALVRIYHLAARPAEVFVCGMTGGLDYAGLCFGARYRLTRDLCANRGGALSKGEKVHFIGYYKLPDDNGLRLFFERATGEHLTLAFDGSAADAPGVTARILRGADYFAAVRFDLSSRTRKLTAARAVLFHLRKKEAQP